jgi:hypothetical protein
MDLGITRLVNELFYSDSSHYHSGELKRSAGRPPRYSNNGMTGTIGVNVIYARIQEEGGTITKKTKK